MTFTPEPIDKWHILLVEDDADNLTMTAQLLRNLFKMQVHEATSGKQALEVLTTLTTPVKAILTDVSMANIDGVELRNQLRQRQEFNYIPIIAVTAHAMKGDREKYLALGFNGYIAKPIKEPGPFLKQILTAMKEFHDSHTQAAQ